MARRNRRSGKGRREGWDDAEEWQPRLDARARRDTRRRGRHRHETSAQPPPAPAAPPPFSLLPEAPPEARTCGRCQEWIGDELGGRGECLHPGSGILRPWWDTPACPFFH